MLSEVRRAHSLCAALCGTQDDGGLIVAERVAELCPEDRSEYAIFVREALCCYVNSMVWKRRTPPLPLDELLNPNARSLGSIAQPAYSAYYQALHAHSIAIANYDSYNTWLSIFMRGPQPLLPKPLTLCDDYSDLFYTFDQRRVLEHVRACLAYYLTDLSRSSITYRSAPPLPPPSVASLIRTCHA